VFDVAAAPSSTAFFQPLESYLEDHGATVCKGTSVRRVEPRGFGGYVVEHDGGLTECDMLVLALDVAALKQVIASSPELPDPLARAASRLEVTRPFGVLRLWLDRPLAPERAVFAGTSGVGELDSIAIYDRFQDESMTWAERHRGSVVELHGYALRISDPAAVCADLIAGLHTLYPESKRARIVDQRFSLRDDCPAFPPGGYESRPSPETGSPDLALAGDFVRMPFPCALMERAAASGLLAANLLLAQLGVAPEPIHSVPSRGLFAPIHTPRSHAIGATLAR
jgi:isorenieratene synthase